MVLSLWTLHTEWAPGPTVIPHTQITMVLSLWTLHLNGLLVQLLYLTHRSLWYYGCGHYTRNGLLVQLLYLTHRSLWCYGCGYYTLNRLLVQLLYLTHRSLWCYGCGHYCLNSEWDTLAMSGCYNTHTCAPLNHFNLILSVHFTMLYM